MSFRTVLRDVLVLLAVGAAALGLVSVLPAQEPVGAASNMPQAPTGQTVVPALMRYSGAAPNRAGDTVEAVFRIYPAAEGGEAIWSETQRVTIGADGKYSILLGGASRDGLPAQVFAAGESRWIGVSIERAAETPRTPLVSVAYAMKAADADSVGGLAAGDLVTQGQLAAIAKQMAASAAISSGPAPMVTPPTGTGTSNYLPMWSSASTLGNSAIYQGGTAASPLVGVNTAAPFAPLDVNGWSNFRGSVQLFNGASATATAGMNSPQQRFIASSFLSIGSRPIMQDFAWQAIAVNNNTSAPSANLTLMYGDMGATPTATGLAIFPSGVIQFAPEQTYPGTITSVEPGIGLTGGGTSGNVELTVDTGLVPLVSNINKFSATQNFNAGLTAAGIAVTGNSTFNGSTSFSGPGYGLTGTSSATFFKPNLSQGAGVAGFGDAGVAGMGNSYGLYGIASSSQPNADGVYGEADAANSSAFYGEAGGANGYGVQVYAGGAGGTGVWAYAPSGTGLYTNGDTGMSVNGWSVGGKVVAGAAKGVGISAIATGSAGFGVIASGNAAGMSAQSPNIGIQATETSLVGTGVYGVARQPSKLMPYLYANDFPQGAAAVWGDNGAAASVSYTAAILGSADDNTTIMGFNNSGGYPTLWAHNFGGGGNTNDVVPVFHASGRTGDCVINSRGDTICTGSHSTVAQMAGGERKVEMYAMHAAENWFEDFGTGKLVGGAALVRIDADFAETINGKMDYQVFLTPRGDCEGLYVANQTATSFEVRELRKGTSSIGFNYRITARRAGRETERMADVTAQMKRDARLDKAAEGLAEAAK